MKKIAIIDDDVYIGDMLTEVLMREGYHVLRAYSGTEALYLLSQSKPDLVLLDLMLPGLSGEEILPHIQDIPVIVLSAKVDVQDKVTLLLSGAADYMTKPFAPEELLARIKALTRRKGEVMLDETGYGDFTFNSSTNMLSKGTKSVHLNFKEAEILKLFIAAPDTIHSKDDIIVKVWGYDSDAGSNNVEAYISFLRRKLHFINSSTEIKAIKKMGYRMEK